MSNPCPTSCPCGEPAFGGTDTCEVAWTPCAGTTTETTTTTTDCVGTASYQCSNGPVGWTYYITGDTCAGGCPDNKTCQPIYPSYYGSCEPQDAGQTTQVGCWCQTTTTETTTTTSACAGTCTMVCDGDDWYAAPAACIGFGCGAGDVCECDYPTAICNPAATGVQVTTNCSCHAVPASTTTTTTESTTTTTCTQCGTGNCQYVCSEGTWISYGDNCEASCSCPDLGPCVGTYMGGNCCGTTTTPGDTTTTPP